MKMWLLIGLGSALGGIARHAVHLFVETRLHSAFPWGTLAINLLGSLLIGWVAGQPEQRFSGEGGLLARQFITVGLLGGFTTFSTFSIQMVTLLQQQRGSAAALYVVLSVLLCVGGAAAGLALAGALNRQ